MGYDRSRQLLGQLARFRQAGFQLVAERHQGIDLGDDALLLGKGRKWDRLAVYVFLVESCLCRTRASLQGTRRNCREMARDGRLALADSFASQPLSLRASLWMRVALPLPTWGQTEAEAETVVAVAWRVRVAKGGAAVPGGVVPAAAADHTVQAIVSAAWISH
jgi:hypothetical protein